MQNFAKFAFTQHCPCFCTSCFVTTTDQPRVLHGCFLFFTRRKKQEQHTFTTQHATLPILLHTATTKFPYILKKMQNFAKFAFTQHCPCFCTSCFLITTDITNAKCLAKFGFTQHCPYFCTSCFMTDQTRVLHGCLFVFHKNE